MNQPVIMQYNEESAIKAGGGEYVSEGGAHLCEIVEAKYIKAKTNSSGIEFSLVTDSGLKCNYVTVYYAKEDKSPITGGQSVINAIMGLTGLKSITTIQRGGDWICPELEQKKVGLFLQKRLYTKKNGSEGYEFSIRAPFDYRTQQTLKEKVANHPADAISRWQESYKDLDERKAQAAAQQSSGYEEYSDMPDF